MNYKNLAIKEIATLSKTAKEKIGADTQRWLDVAYKLDYISLTEKERITSLIDRWKESTGFDTELFFSENEYHDLMRMRQIAENTVFAQDFYLAELGKI